MPTHSRVARTETREMVERDRARLGSRMHEPFEWKMGNHSFFIALVVIAAALVTGFIALK